MPEPIAWSPGLWELLFVFFGVAAAAFPAIPTTLTLGFGVITIAVLFFACLGGWWFGPVRRGRETKKRRYGIGVCVMFFSFFFSSSGNL